MLLLLRLIAMAADEPQASPSAELSQHAHSFGASYAAAVAAAADDDQGGRQATAGRASTGGGGWVSALLLLLGAIVLCRVCVRLDSSHPARRAARRVEGCMPRPLRAALLGDEGRQSHLARAWNGAAAAMRQRAESCVGERTVARVSARAGAAGAALLAAIDVSLLLLSTLGSCLAAAAVRARPPPSQPAQRPPLGQRT